MNPRVKEVIEADEKAERAALAFVLGKFPEYWQEEYDAAKKRLEERYAELAGGGGAGDRQAGG